MSSLLRMSDRELLQEASGSKYPWRRAFVVAAASAVFAVIGMQLRYEPGDATPLPGMDHFTGQLTLSGILAGSMVVTAWFFQTRLVRRLQYAVVFSLLLHAVICLALRILMVGMPLMPVADAGERDVGERQMSLPEYGGMESMNVTQPEWERTTDVDIAENAQPDMDRQEAQPEANADPEQVQHEAMVASVDAPTRRENAERMNRAEDVEINRQMRDAETDVPEVEQQQVSTTETNQVQLEARDMNRSRAELQQQREMLEVQHRQQRRLSASRIRRSEATPNQIERTTVESTNREAAQATVSDTTAEAPTMADTSDARRMNAQARAFENSRTSDSNLPVRQQSDNDAPRSDNPVRVSSATPNRSANADGMSASAAPAAGGAAAMQRSASGAASRGAAGSTSAAATDVAAAGSAGNAGLRASGAASASSVARGGASVPTRSAAGGGGAPSTRRSARGTGALRAGSLARRSGSGSGARLGSAAAGGFSGGSMGRSSSGASTGAAGGTEARGAAVSGAAAGGGSSGSVLAGGPSRSASTVGRGGGGLPAGSGRGGNGRGGSGGNGPPSGTGRSGALAARSGSGSSGLTGRTGPSARLGGVRGGARASGNGTRRAAAAALPAGAMAAEQSGQLVIAGPQAPDAGNGGGSGRSGLSGPRIGSTARRSAGLPGSSRGGGSTSVARRRAGLPGTGSSRASRRRSSGGRPRLASEGEIAGLIKRNMPGISPIQTEQISPGFSMRRPEMRREVVEKLGGNDASEAAVERGLKWLAAHQHQNGSWSIDAIACEDHDCGQHGAFKADVAATGLALMAFLGAGHTHQKGDYQEVVRRGLEHLIARQRADSGDLFASGDEFTWFYSHGMASIALCEAYGMTKDAELRDPAQLSLDFIVASQHPQFGGWRYKPRFESDTSVSGWQLMALKSGEMAGLSVPPSAYRAIGLWLDSVEAADSPGTFAYHSSRQPSPAMTAEGLLMRQYLGASRTDKNLVAGADYLKMRLPRPEARDVYYWYYATQVMFHLQGEHWAAWNADLRDMLIADQVKDGPARGSWDAASPTRDKWGKAGGRHYMTCMHILMLEIYYRHLPLYIDFELGR